MLYITKYHIPKKWSQDAQVPEIKKNNMLFDATFLYDLQEMLTVKIIPIQVAQWIASWTSVSNRIRGLRVRSHQIPLLFLLLFYTFHLHFTFLFTLFDITIILFYNSTLK